MRLRRKQFTEADKLDLWKRWKSGEPLTLIADALERNKTSIFTQLAACGGYAPQARRRRESALTLADREEISRGIARAESLRSIARRIGRPASTVCREIARNGGAAAYRAVDADEHSRRRALRPKRCKLAMYASLRRGVARGLRRDWSPEQISKWLKVTFADDPRMHVSTETIYRSLFVQARGVLKKELVAHLRTQRKFRVPRAHRPTERRSTIVDAVSISERPASVEDRAVPGHWEGDLIQGANFSYVATLVERSTRFVMLVKLSSKETDVVVAALKRHITKLPTELRRTLTWDRGLELAAHKKFSVDTDVAVYFCDPHSPWQRGTNENTNGLLRQYFRPGTDLRDLSQADLNAIAKRLNERPRKTLGFRTPAAMMQALLH